MKQYRAVPSSVPTHSHHVVQFPQLYREQLYKGVANHHV